LWLDITAAGRAESATLTIDASELFRNGARWGRPTLLVCESSGSGAGAWRAIKTKQAYTLEANAHLIVIAVGHSVSVNFAEIFSTLADMTVSPHSRSRQERAITC
jgi:hypothetical protein